MMIEQFIAVICAALCLLTTTFLYLAYKSKIKKFENLKRRYVRLRGIVLSQRNKINFYKNIAAGAGIADDDKIKRKIDSDLILSSGVECVKGETR